MHCRCCRNLILNRNFVDLFKVAAKKENILEAIAKYGGIAVRDNEPGKSTVICRSCFLLVKGINDRVRKFSLLCQNNDNNRETTNRLATLLEYPCHQ